MNWRTALAIASAPLLLGCARPDPPAVQRNCDVLCGHVIDAATSKPIEKFTLTLYTRDPHAGRPMYALPHGYPYPPGRLLQHAEISSKSGDFDLTSPGVPSILISISAPGHLLYQSQPIELPSRDRLEVRLNRAWEVSGRVVDERGVGVAGVALYPDAPESLDQWIQSVRQWPPHAQTDANGRFTFGDIQSFQRDTGVVALRSGFVPRRVLIPIAGPRTSFDISLETAVAVNGIVVDSGGRPAANAWIEAKPSSGEVRRAATRSDGQFTFDALPRHHVHFSASRQLRENAAEGRLELGYASESDIDPATTSHITLKLPASGAVHGGMTGLGREGTGYQVQLRCAEWSSTIAAGTRGDFSAIAPAGECDVTGLFSDSMSKFETDSKHIVIADGSEAAVNLHFGNPTELRISWNGVPMPQQVSITRSGQSQPVARLYPDRDVYRFAGLRSGLYDATFENFDGVYRIPLEIGSQPQFAFDLRTGPAQLSVIGDEKQSLSAKITILQPHYARAFPAPLDPTKFTAFLPFGEYEIRIESRGYQQQEVTFRVPGEQQVVKLAPLPLPFTHPAVAEPIGDDEREVLAAVLRDFEKGKVNPGAFVLMNQTAQPRVELGFIYDSGDIPSKQLLARIKGSPAYAVLEQRRSDVRALDALAQHSIRLLPFNQMPLQRPEYRHGVDIESECIDPEAFQTRFPDAVRVMLSRAGISGDEAIVFASRMPGLGVDERLIRLQRVGGRWQITDSVLLESTPGC